jgi:hypothetical protein
MSLPGSARQPSISSARPYAVSEPPSTISRAVLNGSSKRPRVATESPARGVGLRF